MKHLSFALLAVLVSMMLGCQTEQAADPGANLPAPTDDTATPNEPPAPEVISVAVVDGAGFDKIRAQQSGKVILVDYWATW